MARFILRGKECFVRIILRYIWNAAIQTIYSMCNSNFVYCCFTLLTYTIRTYVLNACISVTYHRWSIDVPVSSRCFISHILLYKLIFVNNVTQAIKHIPPYANYMSLLNIIMALSYYYSGIAWRQGIKKRKRL